MIFSLFYIRLYEKVYCAIRVVDINLRGALSLFSISLWLDIYKQIRKFPHGKVLRLFKFDLAP